MLAALGITARTGQVLLTQGTSQALELVIRYLLKPGDTALVDDPGYYNMFGNLRAPSEATCACRAPTC
jgi:DNA-binding transcriptional MocR family regulator